MSKIGFKWRLIDSQFNKVNVSRERLLHEKEEGDKVVDRIRLIFYFHPVLLGKILSSLCMVDLHS